MTARWLRAVEAAGEPGMVALQECSGPADNPAVHHAVIMTAEIGSHVGFDLARLSVAMLKREREAK